MCETHETCLVKIMQIAKYKTVEIAKETQCPLFCLQSQQMLLARQCELYISDVLFKM